MTLVSRKLFFWIFGVVFSLVTYLLIENTTLFVSIQENTGYSLIISLVIIVLFFVLGLLLEMIDYPLKYLFKSKKNINLNNFSEELEKNKKDQELKIFSKNLRKTLDFIVKQNYSDKSLNILREFVGFDEESVQNIIKHTKTQRKIKIVYWSLGIVLSTINIFFVTAHPAFEFLRTTWFVPYAISLTIFLLFFVEGILVIRMPSAFYLNILNINRDNLKKNKKQVNEMINQKQKLSEQKDKALDNVLNSLSYMLNMNISKEKIIEHLEKEGIDPKLSEQLIESAKNKNKKIDANKTPLLLKLFLSNVHDEFKSLKEMYSQIKELSEGVGEIEKKQKKLSVLLNENAEDLKQLEKQQKQLKNMVGNKSTIKDKKISKKINIEAPEEKNKYVETIFETIKPYTKIYTKNQIESFLISNNVDIGAIQDVFYLCQKRNISFAKDKKSLGTQFVFFVNNIYDTFNKK